MTDIIRVAPENPDPAAIARAAECLRNGGLVAFPTETVYGLGVNALDRLAVQRLFAAKQRPAARYQHPRSVALVVREIAFPTSGAQQFRIDLLDRH